MGHGTVDEKAALAAFCNVNFLWVDTLRDAREAMRLDIPEVNAGARETLAWEVRKLKGSGAGPSALVKPVIGNAGAGKTHLLNSLRELTVREGGYFIPADLTNIVQFHATVNSAAMDALKGPAGGGRQPLAALLDNILAEAGAGGILLEADEDGMPRVPPEELRSACQAARLGLNRRHRREAGKHDTVLKDVFSLASADMDEQSRATARLIGDPATLPGLSWLMSLNGGFSVLAMDQLDAVVAGHMADPSNAARQALIQNLSKNLAGLHSSLTRTLPVLSIVHEVWDFLKKYGQRPAIDRFNTPCVLTALNDPAVIAKIAARRLAEAYGKAGFRPPYPSWPFPEAFCESLKGGYTRDVLYACDKYIETCRADNRADEWPGGSAAVNVREDPELAEADRAFEEARARVPPLADWRAEQAFWDEALKAYAECFAVEAGQAAMDAGLALGFSGGGRDRNRYVYLTASAPARKPSLTVCAVFQPHQTVYCERLDEALIKSGADPNFPERRLVVVRTGPKPGKNTGSMRAYLRLVGAGARMAEPTGIDVSELMGIMEVKSRHPLTWKAWARARKPAGRTALLKEELEWLRESGGTGPESRDPPATMDEIPRWAGGNVNAKRPQWDENAPPEETRPAHGYGDRETMLQTPDDGTREGTPQTRANADRKAPLKADDNGAREDLPLSRGDFGQEAQLQAHEHGPREGSPQARGTDSRNLTATGGATDGENSDDDIKTSAQAFPAADSLGNICLGNIVRGWKDPPGEPVLIPAEDLCRHVAVMGSSGSGKTVIVKRIIEEAALLGIPSIVIDCSGDLACMSRPWPVAPEGFTAGDRAKAERFSREAEVIVWTPFSSNGNLFRLPRIPDLRALANDKEAMNDGLKTGVEAVLSLLRKSKNPSNHVLSALTDALRSISKPDRATPGPRELLRELKILAEADEDERDSAKSFYKAVDTLLDDFASAKHLDTNFEDNSSNDIGDLLDSSPGRTRVSVLNISSASLGHQQLFVEGLMTALFSRMTRKHPRKINGLVVIDEAKEFVPAVEGSVCKLAIRRFASMARKYHYGLILASQELKSMDNRAVNNCNTKLFGKQTSNAAIDAAEKGLEAGTGLRMSHLLTGQFYLKSDSIQGKGTAPVKVKTSWCLTMHGDSPEEEEILEYARQSTERRARRSDP